MTLNRLTGSALKVLVASLFLMPVSALAAVSDITVTLSNTATSATPNYQFVFQTTQAIGHNQYFYIVFGGATTFNANATSNWLVNGNAPQNTTRSGQEIQLKIANNSDIPAGEVTITHTGAGVINPSTASSAYTVDVYTTNDAAGTSEPYTITSSTTVSVGAVSVSPATVSSVAQYRISSALASDAALASGNSLTYTFPSGTTIPPSLSTSAVTLTHAGTPVSISSVSTNPTNRTVTLTLGASLAASGPDTVTFSTSAGIANPSTSGSKQITLSTTLQPNAGTSTAYTIDPSTTLTPANVAISPNAFKTAAQYTLTFAVGSSGALTANSGTITIVFPNDTEVPSSIATSKVTVNGTNAYAVSTTPGTRTVTITTGVSISNQASVTVVIDASAGIKNPTTTGSYTLSLSTSAETAQTSNSYSVVQSTIATPTFTPSSDQPSVETPYTVAFNVGSGGNLVAGSSSITIDFDDATTLASSIPASDVTVNGTLVSLTPTVNTSARTITVTSPVNVSANGSVSVEIWSGVTNPVIGTYTSTVKTSVETTAVASNSYQITSATAVTNRSVTTSNTAVGPATSTYTITFTANNTIGGFQSIYVDFPDAFGISGASATVTDDGAGVTLQQTDKDATSALMRMQLKNSETIAGGSVVQVTISTATNPTTAKGNYVIKVYTTADASPASLPYVTITSGTSLTGQSIVPSPTTTNTIAAYTVSLTTASNAQMSAAVDTFYVKFPSGSTVPSSIAASAITVNGTDAAGVVVLNDTVKIATPVSISPSTTVTLDIKTAAGIRNPTTAGSQTWYFKTNLQRTLVSANATITAISTVSAANVTPSPTTVNTAAQYTLDFTLGSTALSSGNTITVTFPDNTSVPTSMSTSAVTLKEAGVTQTLTSVSTSPSARQVTITVGEAVAAGASMQVVFSTAAGIANPSTSGNSYTLTLAATGNGSSTSNVYGITTSQVQPATVTPSPSTQSNYAEYTVAFNVGAGGALTAGSGTITIVFPTGTTVPSFIAANNVTINGAYLTTSPTVNSGTVTLTTPVNVANNGSVSVVFSADAQITNPATVSTGYTAQVYTSTEPTSVASLAYAITAATDISNVSVSLGSSAISTATSYTISFKTGSGGLSVGNIIYVQFPTGTTVPASISNTTITINGSPSSSVTTTPSTRLVSITSNSTVGAGSTVTLAFTDVVGEKITNPASTGSNYTLTARIGAGSTPVTSAKYTITTTTALTGATVTPSPATTSSSASYTVSATTSSNGALAVGDSIIVVFPSGTTVPSSMAAGAVSVNGVTATTSPVINQSSRRVAVVTPAAVSASSSFSLVFSTSAGLVNPASATSYTADVSTNIQTTAATSSSYTISASSTVSAANVTPNPTTVNVVAQYDLSFSLGSTSGLSVGNTITLTFPGGTTIPSSISTGSVTLKDDGATMGSSPSQVSTDPTNRTVTLTVGDVVAASSAMQVIFSTTAGIKNPTSAANNYTLTVAATNNGSAESNVYTITSSSVCPATVTPSPTTASVAAQYTVSFTTGSGGALTAGSHTISLVFPSGTTIPATMAANKVTVNGTALVVTPTCNQTTRTITLTTPVNVSANGNVSVVFSSDAGIQNPSAGSNYAVSVSTTTEPTAVQSNAYSITAATSISGVTVSLGDPAISTATTYTISFTTGTGGLAIGDTIFFQFPTGTTIPASITASTVTINGTESSAVITDPSARQVRVRSGSTVGASSTASVAFTNVSGEKITNPSTSGSNYTLTARIGVNATQVTSAKYTITAPSSETLATATVTPSPDTASATASYTITTMTGAHGALVDGDTVTVVFPSGTTLPSSIAALNVSINGTACTVAPVVNSSTRTVKVISSNAVAASSSLTVVIGPGAGIVNPPSGSYTLSSLYTNIQPTPNSTVSSSYSISAATQVSAANVTPSPATVSATAQYTLAFTIGGTGNLTLASDTIFVVFPSGTTVPSSISKSNVTVNGVDANNVVVSSQTAKIAVGSTISAGASVTVVFKSAAGVSNPGTAGNYTATVYTSKEPTQVSSNVYTITASTVSSVAVSLSNQLTNQLATYTVTFTTGSGGALTSGVGTISITFPSGTGIGIAVARSSPTTPQITVNGTNASTVTVNGLTVTITTPVNITANTSVTVVFNSGAGMLTNPGTPNNSYQVTLKTSAEGTSVSSSTYAVTATTTVSNVTVSLSAQGDGQTATYTIGFRLGSAGALASTDSIIVIFPSTTSIAALVAGDVTVANNANPPANPSAAPVISGLQVTIPMPSAASYANGDSVTVVVSNGKITNPTTTGGNKTLSVNTTKEPDPVSSATYTIISTSTTLTSAVVNANPNEVSSVAAYTLTFSTGSKGALRIGDTFTVTFPSGTTVPASISASNVRVNGTAPTVDPTVNTGTRKVVVTLPVVVDTSASVEIAFLSGASLTNPATEGFYTLTISSSIETTSVTSASYGIAKTVQIGNLVVDIGPSSPSNQNVTLSQSDVAALQLKLTASDYEALDVSVVKVKANGTGADNQDISSVKLYADPNGQGFDGDEVLLGSTTFSADDTIATFGSLSVQVPAGLSRYLVVTYTMSTSGISGRTFYPTVVNNTYFSVTGNTSGSPIAGDSLTVTAAPITGATLTMASAVVTVTGTDISPVSTNPGATDVPMLKLSLTASSSNAVLQSIKVNNKRTGVGVFYDTDVDLVKVYLDNGNGTFSPSEETLIGSSAVTGASGGSGTVTFSPTRTIGSTASVYFIAYDISASAPQTNVIAAQLADSTYLSVASPSTVSSANFPIETSKETSLPVELGTFIAHARKDAVELNWITHSETENYGWRVLRLAVDEAADTTALANEGPEGIRGRAARSESVRTLGFLRGQGNKSSATEYTYLDMTAEAGRMYAYYLVDIDFYGHEAYHGPLFASVGMPHAYRLAANYPNPFNPTTLIEFALPAASQVRLAVYNALGQEVVVLSEGVLQPGYHRVVWDGMDGNGRAMGSGIYLYRLEAASADGGQRFGQTRTMTLLR